MQKICRQAEEMLSELEGLPLSMARKLDPCELYELLFGNSYVNYEEAPNGTQEKRVHTHKCTLYGKEVTLTPIEFSILWYLCENRGKVISSEELFENIWGEKFLDNNNTVMAHIGRLREKLNEPAKKPKFIKTVWGVGYTIEK